MQLKETGAYDEAADIRLTPSGIVISDTDNAAFDHQSALMTSSLLLQPDDVDMTSSRDFAADVWTDGGMTADSSPFS